MHQPVHAMCIGEAFLHKICLPQPYHESSGISQALILLILRLKFASGVKEDGEEEISKCKLKEPQLNIWKVAQITVLIR